MKLCQTHATNARAGHYRPRTGQGHSVNPVSTQPRRRRFRNLADAIEAYLARGGGVVSTGAVLRFIREHLPVVEHTDRELEDLVLLHAIRRSRAVVCDVATAAG